MRHEIRDPGLGEGFVPQYPERDPWVPRFPEEVRYRHTGYVPSDVGKMPGGGYSAGADEQEDPGVAGGLLPWADIFSQLDIPSDYLELLTSPTTYWPGMSGYGEEFKDVGTARGSVRDILTKLLGTGEGSIAEAESQRTALVTGTYGTGVTAAQEAKVSGLGITGERFRAGEQRATTGGMRDIRGTREATRLARTGAGFAGAGAIGEEEKFSVGRTVKDFAESILGLTTVRSGAESDILNRFGTRMEDLSRTQTAGMYNVRDVIEQMRGGGSDMIMSLINQFIDVRNRVLARGGGPGGDTDMTGPWAPWGGGPGPGTKKDSFLI